MADPRDSFNGTEQVYSYANNQTDSITTYNDRIFYSDFIFPTLNVTNFFDFWNEDRFYGRSDVAGNSIVIRNGYLKQLRYTESDSLFALNFVADAWRDFCDRLNKLQQENI